MIHNHCPCCEATLLPHASECKFHDDCPEAARDFDHMAELRAEIARLRLAIRRLADQDATLSVVGGRVTVTMDATLTDAEREAVENAAYFLRQSDEAGLRCAATLRGLLERLK